MTREFVDAEVARAEPQRAELVHLHLGDVLDLDIALARVLRDDLQRDDAGAVVLREVLEPE
jgi:hypothetical protein